MEKLSQTVGIIIMGPMRAGKTTAAGYFREKYGIPKFALADKLKELHYEVTGSDEKNRQWLQDHGNAARTVFGDDFWADALVQSLEEKKVTSFVVDDVRYTNEFDKMYAYAQKHCDIVVPVFIKVSLENIILRGGETELLTDASEKFARTIQNRINGDVVMVSGVQVPVIDGNAPLTDFFYQLYEATKLPVKIRTEIVDSYKVEHD